MTVRTVDRLLDVVEAQPGAEDPLARDVTSSRHYEVARVALEHLGVYSDAIATAAESFRDALFSGPSSHC